MIDWNEYPQNTPSDDRTVFAWNRLGVHSAVFDHASQTWRDALFSSPLEGIDFWRELSPTQKGET